MWWLVWTACGGSAGPGEAATAALVSDDVVEVVDDGPTLAFLPTAPTSDAGLVLYPGGKVEREAYAPILRRVAEAGYPAFIVAVPSDLAIFGVKAAGRVIDDYPDLGPWVLGGHSLGGVAASIFADGNDDVTGLLLMAAFPPKNRDLSASGLAVSSLWGTEDGLVTEADWQDSADRLPSDAQLIAIPGANHASFGDYGDQADDGTATVPSEDVWDLVAAEAVALLGGP
jgi:hypothetical protein